MKRQVCKISIIVLIISLFGLFAYICDNSLLELFLAVITTIVLISFFNYKEENSSFLKEDDIYEIIHDIKTPITAELKITEHLLKGTFGTLNDTQKDIIIQINNSTMHVCNLINNISTLCREENTKTPILFERVNFNELIIECIQELKYIAAEKRCTILFDYDRQETYIYASRTEIKRVLINLLTNAVNYSYSDRIITTSIKTMDNKCFFGINSFGDYLDKNDIQNIFLKYKSIKSTSTSLGLYICNLILEKHN